MPLFCYFKEPFFEEIRIQYVNFFYLLCDISLSKVYVILVQKPPYAILRNIPSLHCITLRYGCWYWKAKFREPDCSLLRIISPLSHRLLLFVIDKLSQRRKWVLVHDPFFPSFLISYLQSRSNLLYLSFIRIPKFPFATSRSCQMCSARSYVSQQFNVILLPVLRRTYCDITRDLFFPLVIVANMSIDIGIC